MLNLKDLYPVKMFLISFSNQMLLSGGVDSTVCAALMNRALGFDRVLAIHIDNGFMRKAESNQVRDSLAKIGLNVRGTLS